MALKGKQVLIVDDAADIRLLARKALENSGMLVTEAASVDQAFLKLEEALPHLILLDLRMPVKSGFTFLEARARFPAIASIPVIVVSAANERDFVYRAAGLGAADYLLKPFTVPLLMQKVRKLFKDADFRSFRFAPAEQPVVQCAFPAELSKISEASFFIESGVKLGGKAQVSLRIPQLDGVELEGCVYVTEPSMGVRGVSGQYFSRVNVAGLLTPFNQILRKAGVR